MSDNDKMREDFEAHIPFKLQMQRDESGRYLNERVRIAWDACCAVSAQSQQEIAQYKALAADNKNWFAELKVDFDAVNKEVAQLRREVAMLRDTLKHVEHNLEECGYSVDGVVRTTVRDAIFNTQATAQAREAEVEARGAVKALEDAAANIDLYECSEEMERKLLAMAESIRATSKKAGEQNDEV